MKCTCLHSTVHEVMQSVVEKEVSGNNLVVFGLEKLSSKDLSRRLNCVLQALGEKPRYAVVRICKKVTDSLRPRPVKVTLLSSIKFLLRPKWQNTRDYRKIQECADRSSEQRDLHKQLVIDTKKK